jgi:hypothetical protein
MIHIARVVWNTSGWRFPTGGHAERARRSGRRPTDYASIHGFGHEEWNFKLEDEFEGHIYGHVKYDAKVRRERDEHLHFAFWAQHPGSDDKLLVGQYKDASFVTPQQIERLGDHFRKEGILERRVSELLHAVPQMSEVAARQHIEDALSPSRPSLRFRCPISNVTQLPPTAYEKLPDKIEGKQLGPRYTPTIVTALPIRARRTRQRQTQSGPLSLDGYYRETGARAEFIERRHNELSRAFTKYLRAQGYRDVAHEVSSVDVEFTAMKELCRAELKVSYPVNTRYAIREALGQLLEYNYYGERQPAPHWFIVLDTEPTPEDKRYVDRLNSALGCQITLGWQEKATFKFSHLPPPATK